MLTNSERGIDIDTSGDLEQYGTGLGSMDPEAPTRRRIHGSREDPATDNQRSREDPLPPPILAAEPAEPHWLLLAAHEAKSNATQLLLGGRDWLHGALTLLKADPDFLSKPEDRVRRASLLKAIAVIALVLLFATCLYAWSAQEIEFEPDAIHFADAANACLRVADRSELGFGLYKPDDDGHAFVCFRDSTIELTDVRANPGLRIEEKRGVSVVLQLHRLEAELSATKYRAFVGKPSRSRAWKGGMALRPCELDEDFSDRVTIVAEWASDSSREKRIERARVDLLDAHAVAFQFLARVSYSLCFRPHLVE
jgi:hypothetical protein